MTEVAKARIITGLRGFAAMVFTIAASPVLNEAGVSFQTISIGFGVLYSILAIAEIPTGAWADIFGARKSAIAGGLIQTASLLVLALGPIDPVSMIVGFALYGFGSSFVSGALSALLFGSTKAAEGESFNSSRYFSIIEKSAVASYILASAIVGPLGEWFGRGAFLFAGGFYFLASVLVYFGLNELPAEWEFHSARKEFFLRIGEGFSGIFQSLNLKLLLPSRMLHQIETILGVLWLPWIRDLGGNGYWISVLATGSYVLRYIVNHFLTDRARPHSYIPRLAISLALMTAGAVICIFANTLWMGLLGIWIIAGARGAYLPAVQAIQHEEFSERVRTTGLSVMNFATESIFAISYFFSAAFINQLGVSTAWQISAVSFALACLITIVGAKSDKA